MAHILVGNQYHAYRHQQVGTCLLMVVHGQFVKMVAALSTELSALGATVREAPDGLHIVPKPLRGRLFHTYHDHRMATAGAIIGLRVPDLTVENIETTGKTLPGFSGLWEEMLG